MQRKETNPIAIIRPVSDKLADCELTHLERTPIDSIKAEQQHKAYGHALERLGYEVIRLPAAPDLPDGVFVEDCAIVVPEIAIITRPGAVSRRPEIETVKPVLAAYRNIVSIKAPGTVDGGDVLVAGKKVFVGLSARTNEQGLIQIRNILEPLGYSVTGVSLKGCLHLKTAVTHLTDSHLLYNPDWVNRYNFREFEMTAVHPDEPFAANVMAIGNHILCSASGPKTAQIINDLGFDTLGIDQSELAKAEAGLTCCSILIN